LKQKIDGSSAATFSFLLAIPTIAGAFILNIESIQLLDPTLTKIYMAGALSAFTAGYISLRGMMWIVNKTRLADFAWYSWGLGIALLILAAI